MKTRVKELLDFKGRQVIRIPATSVYEATAVMSERNIGCVLVMAPGNAAMTGLCTERDIFRRLVLARKDPDKTTVAEVMTPVEKLITVTPMTTIVECMQIMTTKRVRHLPVLTEDGKIDGMLSIGDVVRRVGSEKDMVISQLEHYIEGSL